MFGFWWRAVRRHRWGEKDGEAFGIPLEPAAPVSDRFPQKRAFPLDNFFVRLFKGKKPWSRRVRQFFLGSPKVKFGELASRTSRSNEEERI
jgi:hypothetical protein